jgi:hypothetical protein
MNGPEILMSVAADLEHLLRCHDLRTPANIPTISPSVAAALLQKGIRRGRVASALAAASMLLHTSPDRLWRRLAVIAVEDIGLGDLDAVYMTITAAAHRRRLARRFGEWHIASFVVSRLASAPKCRATDDLHVVTQDCPTWHHDQLELAELSSRDLLDVIAGNDPIERRAIAVRAAISAAGSSSGGVRAGQRDRPNAVFDLLCEITPHTMAEVARSAYRQTREPICAFLPLLHQQFVGSGVELRSDPTPPETIVGGIPGWAYDKFSREGRAALDRFQLADCATTDWLRLHVTPGERTAVLGHAVFRVESGLVADRLIWPTSDSLRRQADLDSWPFGREDAATLLALMRTDIGILNRMREAIHVA